MKGLGVISGRLVALRSDYTVAEDSVKPLFPTELTEAVLTHPTRTQDREFEKKLKPVKIKSLSVFWIRRISKTLQREN